VEVFVKVWFQFNLETFIKVYRYLCIFISHAADAYFIRRSYILQTEVPVLVGEDDAAFFGYIHHGSGNRIAFRVHNTAFQRLCVLCPDSAGGKE